jgi:hypothetical protein
MHGARESNMPKNLLDDVASGSYVVIEPGLTPLIWFQVYTPEEFVADVLGKFDDFSVVRVDRSHSDSWTITRIDY